MADRREFIGTYECMGGTTYAADYRWEILGEAEEVVRCRDCKWFNHERPWCGSCGCDTEPTGYCWRGERA